MTADTHAAESPSERDQADRAALRAAIDEADAKLVDLLAERRRLAETLGALKAGEGAKVRDMTRERDVTSARGTVRAGSRASPAT